MPANPTAAQSAASRENGARSQGPVTEAGKAQAARNAVRHGLCAKMLVPNDPEEAGLYARLRTALLVRHDPADEVEARLVDELAFAALRADRLRGIELRVLDRLAADAEGDAAAALPC